MTGTRRGLGRIRIQPETVLAYLKEVAAEELQFTPERLEKIDPEMGLVGALELDSLAQVVLVTQIEERYGFAFNPSDWEHLRTVGDLVRVIQNRAS